MATNQFEKLLLDQNEHPVLALGMAKLGRLLETGRRYEKARTEKRELEEDLVTLLRDHRLPEQLKAPEGHCIVITLNSADAPCKPFIGVKKGQKFEFQRLDLPDDRVFRFIAGSIKVNPSEIDTMYEPRYDIWAVSVDGNRMLLIPNEGWKLLECFLDFVAVDAIPPEVIAETEAAFSSISPS